jgi:hypothetical protein
MSFFTPLRWAQDIPRTTQHPLPAAQLIWKSSDMEFDNLATLADPIFALALVAVGGCLLSGAMWWLLAFLHRTKRKSDVKLLIAAAEMLGAIGLIGLITFAGRAKMDDDEFKASVVKFQATAALQSQVSELLALPQCQASGAPVTAENEMTASGLCDFLRIYDHEKSDTLFWHDPRRASGRLSASLIKSNQIDEGMRFAKLVYAIENYDTARQQLTVKKRRQSLNKIEAPWTILLICTFLASFGVSIKIARSGWEWWDERKKSLEAAINAAAVTSQARGECRIRKKSGAKPDQPRLRTR